MFGKRPFPEHRCYAADRRRFSLAPCSVSRTVIYDRKTSCSRQSEHERQPKDPTMNNNASSTDKIDALGAA
ncbi:hypothetical protein, partial [Xanthomonas euvesicatoria]|uniref:hypothetical protein n=1 Tax=Xanthomonas euvesicatoria TaxID=456327 RepID=UPI0019D393CE